MAGVGFGDLPLVLGLMAQYGMEEPRVFSEAELGNGGPWFWEG